MTSDPAYFLYHSIGLYPDKAEQMAAAMAKFASVWGATDDAQWPTVLAERAEFLTLWSHLIAAPKGTLTSAENVTTALFSIFGGLPKERLAGKRVLIAADCFPSLHFLLSGLQDRLGFTLHTVPLRAGEYWVRDQDMLDAWDEQVGLALLTFVTSTASHRPDLSTLLAHGKRMGSLVGIDLTQGIGILPFSVRDSPVDFAVSTTLKWLCGTPGAGVIYMRNDLLPDMQPDLRGWFSQDNPFQWDLDRFSYAPDARRFEHGTPSVLACVGSVPALRWHAAQTDLLEHNRALTDAIIAHARETRLTLASPAHKQQRGGSVMLELPQGTSPTAIVDALRATGIHLDARGRVLRLSPGVVTQMHHVTQLFGALQKVI